MDIVRFTDQNETFVLGSDATFLGLGGDDVYVVEPSAIPAGAEIVIDDNEGDNTIRFPDGLEITASSVSTRGNGSNAVLLELANGTTILIDGADGFDYEVGGDFGGNNAVPQDFTQFITQTLGHAAEPNPGDTSDVTTPITIGQLPTVSITGADQAEGDPGDVRELVYTVSLDEANPLRDVTVTLELDQTLVTSGDAATPGVDFEAFPTVTVTIPKGATSTQVPVEIIPDADPENDEGVGVRMVAAEGAELSSTPTAVATIIDDDVAAPVPTATLGDVTLLEGDTGDARVMSFVVSLSEATTVPVDVTVQTGAAGDTATAGADYTAVTETITISAGATSGQVDVTLSGDEAVEDDEELTATITNVVNADPASVGNTATGTIENDDGPTVSVRDASVVEGDSGTATMSFTLELSEAFGTAIEVDVTTFDQASAQAGSDYTARTETVTIPANQTSVDFDVDVTGDLADEGDETFGVRISNPGVVGDPDVTVRLGTDEATGTIINDDGDFVLTPQTDVITTDQNSTGGVVADDGRNVFVANEETLNASDVLDGGGQPGTAGGDFPPVTTDALDELFYSTDAVLGTAGATINEAGFTVSDIERFIVQSNATRPDGSGGVEGAPVIFDMSNAEGVDTVGSRNSASGVQFNELVAPTNVLLDNLTNAGQDNNVTVLADADEAAAAFDGPTEIFVGFDDSDVQNITVGLDGVPATNNGLETVNMRVSGATPTLAALTSAQNFLTTLDVVMANGDDDDFNFGTLNGAGNVINSTAFSTLNVGSEAGSDGDFRLLEDINPGNNNTLTIDASGATGEGALQGNMVLSEISVDGRVVNVTGGDNNDVVLITGDPENGGTLDSFSLGDGDDDSVLIGESDINAGRIRTTSDTEAVDVIDDSADGIGGTINAASHGAGTQIRLFDETYGTAAAEANFGEPIESLSDLTGIAPGGLFISNAPDNLALLANLSRGAGDLTIDGTSPATLNFLVTSNVTMNTLTVSDVDTLTLAHEGNGSITYTNLDNTDGNNTIASDNSLERIVLTDDGTGTPGESNDNVDTTIGNNDFTLHEQRSTSNVTSIDATGVSGDVLMYDIRGDDGGFTITGGSGNDGFALGNDDVDDNPGIDDGNVNGLNDNAFGNFDDPAFDNGLTQADTIDAGAGNDRIRVRDFGDLEGSESLEQDAVDGGPGTDTFRVINDNVSGSDSQFAGLSNFEIFQGSGNTDNNPATIEDNIQIGTTFEAAGFNQIRLNAGDDNLNAAATEDGISVDAGSGNDTVIGGDGADSILGQAGDDVLSGGLGDDTIVPGSGQDEAVGNNGADRFRFSGNQLQTDDVVNGGNTNGTDDSADDQILLDNDPDGDGEGDDVAARIGAGVTNIETITALDNAIDDDGAPGVDNDNVIEGPGEEDGIPGDVNVTFDGFVDGAIRVDGTQLDGPRLPADPDGETLFVDATTANQGKVNFNPAVDLITVDGGAGNDTVLGSAANDDVSGGDGDDQVAGNGGNDSVDGDGGDDIILGGNGDDALNGGADSDTILGEAGNDAIDGGEGDDLIQSGSERDNVTGTDIITTGGGVDTIVAAGLGDSLIADTTLNAFSGDVWTDFDFTRDNIAVNLPSNLIDLTNIELGKLTVNVADFTGTNDLATILEQNNNVQDQFNDLGQPKLDIVLLDVLAGEARTNVSGQAGAAEGLYLIVEGDQTGDPFSRATSEVVKIETPGLTVNNADLTLDDIVAFDPSFGQDVTVDNTDDPVVGLPDGTSILPQVFTIQNGLTDLQEPLDGGLGVDTLVLGDQDFDFTTDTVVNFEELDLNGQDATMTLAQYQQFDDITNGGEITITEPVNADGTAETIESDTDVTKYTIASGYGEPVDFVFAGPTVSQDLEINSGDQDDVVRAAPTATQLVNATIETGDGDDQVNLDQITSVQNSTVDGEAGNDVINLAGTTTINPTVLIGGAGADVINVQALEQMQAGSQILLGSNPAVVPGAPDERDVLNAGNLETLAGTVDGGSGDDLLNIGNAAATTLTVSGQVTGGLGDDELLTGDVRVADGGLIDMGDGADTLDAGSVVLEEDGPDPGSNGGELDLGEGGDTYRATSTLIRSDADFMTGSGSDSLEAGQTTIENSGTLSLGSGDDTLRTDDLFVNGALFTFDGADSIDVTGSLTVGGTGDIRLDLGTAFADSLVVSGATSISSGGRIEAGGAGDTIELNGTNSIAGDVELQGGDDTVDLGATTLLSAGELDGGADTDTLNVNGDSDFSSGTLQNFENGVLADGVTMTVTEGQHDDFDSITDTGDTTIVIAGSGGTVTSFSDIETYEYANANNITFTFGSGADAQNYLSTSTGQDTVEMANVGGGTPYTGQITTGAGADTLNDVGNLGDGADIDTGADGDSVNAITGMVAGAVVDTGTGDDDATVTDDLTGGELDLGPDNDTLTIDDGDTTTNQSLGGVELNGGSGTDELIIETNGDVVDISGADISGFESVEFRGSGVVLMSTEQHQALSSAFVAAGGNDRIAFSDATVPTTGNPVIEGYVMSDDGNDFTVNGANGNNTGQDVSVNEEGQTGGDGDDTITFEVTGTITGGELSLDAGLSDGDTLNAPRNGNFNFTVGAGDLVGFENFNFELTGGGANNAENFQATFAAGDIVNDANFDFQISNPVGSNNGVVDTNFALDTGAGTEDILVTDLGLNEATGGTATTYAITTDAGEDEVTVFLTEDIDTTNGNGSSMTFDLGGANDTLDIDLNGFDGNFDTTQGEFEIPGVEEFVARGETNTSAGGVFVFDGNDDLNSLDFGNAGDAANGISLTLNDLATLDPSDDVFEPTVFAVTGSEGDDELDVGEANSTATDGNFAVDLDTNGGATEADDVLIDNDGGQTNTVTVSGFQELTTQNNRIGLNQDNGALDDEFDVTSISDLDELANVNGDAGDTIGTFVNLTGFASAQVASGQLDQTGDNQAVELAIVEGNLDNSTANASVSGDLYVALTDGNDTGIYRISINTGTDSDLDSTGNIDDVELIGVLDDVTSVDSGDFF